MQFKYDVEAMFHFIGDRKNNIYEGYRPGRSLNKYSYVQGKPIRLTIHSDYARISASRESDMQH